MYVFFIYLNVFSLEENLSTPASNTSAYSFIETCFLFLQKLDIVETLFHGFAFTGREENVPAVTIDHGLELVSPTGTANEGDAS